MDEMQFMGYLISALVVLAGFIATIVKFIQPINKLNVTIQKLIDTMSNFEKEGAARDKRITKHGAEIDDLKKQVGEVKSDVRDIKTKMSMYHHED